MALTVREVLGMLRIRVVELISQRFSYAKNSTRGRPASECVGGLICTGQAGRAEGVHAIPLVHGAHAALAAVGPLRFACHQRLHAHRVRGPAELHKMRRSIPPEPAANVLATAPMLRLALRRCVEGLLRRRGGEVALVRVVGELHVLLVVRRLIRFCATPRGAAALAAAVAPPLCCRASGFAAW